MSTPSHELDMTTSHRRYLLMAALISFVTFGITCPVWPDSRNDAPSDMIRRWTVVRLWPVNRNRKPV